MAYAWVELQAAVKMITLADDKRVVLVRALSKLLKLRMKDLPAEARHDFAQLTDPICVFHRNRIDPEEVKRYVTSMTDTDVVSAILGIISMHDAVACYQPLPRHAAAAHVPARTGRHVQSK
jgi:hypothetical protein